MTSPRRTRTRRLRAALLLCVSSYALCASGRDYSAVDAAVTGMPAARSMDQVVRFISGAARDDWEKARGVYVWMTHNVAYDVASFFSGARPVTDAQGVFASRKSVCQGYSELFAAIAKGLGLETVVLAGYAKAYSYAPGQRFRDTNHAWNAVKLDGSWRLVESTWGAGYVDGRAFVPRYTPTWFDMDPRLFALNHQPEDARWLLTGGARTLAEYEAAPFFPTYDLENLLRMGFGAEEVVRLVPRAPFPEFFGSYAGAFRAMGGTTDAILGFLSDGAFPAAYAYEGVSPTLVEYPPSSKLKAGTTYRFAVRVPGCEQAAVITGGKFYFLERDGDLFSGEAPAASGELKLSAKITNNGTTSFWPLMSWRIQ